MPTFSAQYALGKLAEMRHSLASSLRGVLLLSLPASLGLVLLRKPLVVLLYQRGEFDARSTELVAWALLWYAIGLVGHSVVEIVSRAFYALHDTKTPVFIGIGAMSLNVVFSYAFSALFFRVGWLPHGGLALANSLATALEMLALLYLMRKRLTGIEGKSLIQGGLQALAGTAVMFLGLWAWLDQTTNLPDWQVALGGIIIGASLYALVMVVLRVKEARSVTNAIQERIKLLP
jgi:putative peptidoglycan lipid II flippase